MKRRWIIRLSLIGVAFLIAYTGWRKVEGDPGMMLIYFIFAGAITGLLTVKFLLPWIVEALATSLYFPGEKIRPEDVAEEEDESGETDDESPPNQRGRDA